MNALWVAHDRNKDLSWKQSKPELMSLVSNLLFVKKFFPYLCGINDILCLISY